MMKTRNLVLAIILIAIMFSCKRRNIEKTILVKKGTMEVVINNYLNAKTDKEFENLYSMNTSVVFDEKQKIEKIDGIDEFFYVLDNEYTIIDNKEELFIASEAPFYPLSEKQIGLTYQELGFNEEELHEVTEIEENNQKFKSITFKNDKEIKVVLIKPTDTIYSFSMSKELEKRYKGRITNIQIYNKSQDIFTSIYVNYSNKIDKSRKDIMDFNNYLNTKKND